MAVSLFVDGAKRLSEEDIYFIVEIGDEPGKIEKLQDGLTPVLHGTKLRLSHHPSCQTDVIGSVYSNLNPSPGGRIEFIGGKETIYVDDIEAVRILGWAYLVGAKWVMPPESVA